jgi:hypothetical protein
MVLFSSLRGDHPDSVDGKMKLAIVKYAELRVA